MNIDKFITFYRKANIYEVLKNLYDLICFEGARCKVESNTITIRHEDDEYVINKAISQIRIQSNILHGVRSFSSHKMIKLLKENRVYKDRRIRSVLINEQRGVISVDTEFVDFNEELELLFIHNLSYTVFYLDYLSTEGSQKLKSFQILFSILQYLCSKIKLSAIEYEYSGKKLNPNYYLFMIERSKLVSLLKNISKEVEPRIIEFINYLTNNGEVSFWEKPILKNRKYCHFAIHSILSANPLNIYDRWVQDNLTDFDVKGTLFEDFVKNEIKNTSKNKGFYCRILDQKKFSVQKQYEEIDLIWESKNIIVIGEVKNIRFPFTSRNINEYKKIIDKATIQINRKIKFLIQNKTHFQSILNFNKRIVACVITNYPFYSGSVINSVPILDLGALRKYLNVGYSSRLVVDHGIETEIDKQYFYMNEDEFSNNLESYLFDLEAVNIYKGYLSTEVIESEIANGIKLNFIDVVSEKIDFDKIFNKKNAN